MSSSILGPFVQTEWPSPFGPLLLGSIADELLLCDWKHGRHRNVIERRLVRLIPNERVLGTSPVLLEAQRQLQAYFEGRLRVFSVPIRHVGTAFQCRVWEEIGRVPFGQTATYAQLARRAGNPQSVRAVGMITGHNALSIIVPCHRIVGSNGALIGYGGGLDVKAELLRLESAAR